MGKELMNYTKPINTYNSVDEIDKHIGELLEAINRCVGTLYPSIMWDRIDKLRERKRTLRCETQRVCNDNCCT